MSVVTVADLPILPSTTNEEEDGTVKREIKKWRERIKKHDDATVDYVKTPKMNSSCEKDLKKARMNARSSELWARKAQREMDAVEKLADSYKDLADTYKAGEDKCYSRLKNTQRLYDELHSMSMRHLDKR